MADFVASAFHAFRGCMCTILIVGACALSSSAILASVATAAPTTVQRAGATLLAGPGQTGLSQTDGRLDLEDEWRVWELGYWGCRAVDASGGTPVIFCIWIPSHWVTLPYGTEPLQPGVLPNARLSAVGLGAAGHVPHADVAVSSRH